MTTNQAGPPEPDEHAGDEPGAVRPLADLPDPVRQRIVEWAAESLGGLSSAEIPAGLTRVARFAPTKRARLAATALARAVEADSAFRARVAERAARTSTDPGDDAAGPAGLAAGPDPVTAAARAYLLRQPDEDELVQVVLELGRRQDDRARVVDLERQVRALEARLARTESELVASRAAAESQNGPDDEAERLRRRLREQGTRVRELQQQVDQAAARAAADAIEFAAARDKLLAEVRTWQQRAEAAVAKAEAATHNLVRLRESAGEQRGAADWRLEMLLSTLEGAAAGLRREWNLLGGGPSPADVIAERMPSQRSDTGRTAEPSRLMAWIGLRGAHLIVDGYNVTKSGFPELSLSDQRDRLVRGLSALSARTSAEVTVVFDGAAVATIRPPGRGVRVLFSPPGVLADEVVKDLVRAEPPGRVVVVVSSDREVVNAVTGNGARTASSSTLLSVIGG